MGREITKITFERYDFVLARKTVTLEKNGNSTVYLPDGYQCRISAVGMNDFPYENGESLNEVVKRECKTQKCGILPRSVTVSLYRENPVFEVPFKKDKDKTDDLRVLQIKIDSPEKVEDLLKEIPHNKYVEEYRDGEYTTYLFAHYDIEHNIRGLADFVHDEIFEDVSAGNTIEQLYGHLSKYGMKIIREVKR